LDDLVKMGLNQSINFDKSRMEIQTDIAASKQNLRIAQQAFKQLPVDLPACGGGAALADPISLPASTVTLVV